MTTSRPGVSDGKMRDPDNMRRPGVAINAGSPIALAADVILVTRNARFIDTHMELGLLPSWGLSSKLSRAIGINNAKLVSAFRETLSGEEAVRLGLLKEGIRWETRSDGRGHEN